MTAVVVVAKHPEPGRVKTRLTARLTPEEAASVAAAALADTLEALATVPGRRILFSDRPTPAPHGWERMLQPSGGLDERLAHLLDAVDEPLLLVGMDTPQLGPALAPALEPWPDDVDGWLGMAADGGFWALGLRARRGELIRGVSMSHPDTGALTARRLADAGLTIRDLPVLTDIDTPDDLVAVAAGMSGSRTAEAARAADAARTARGLPA